MAALAGMASAADNDPQVPSAADFGERPAFSNPVLSPDGTFVASEARRGDKQVIELVDLDPAKTANTKTIQIPKDLDVRWVRWAGSGKLLVSLLGTAKLYGQFEVPVTRLIMIDVRTGQSDYIGPKSQGLMGDDVLHVDPAGAFLLLSTQPSIFDYPAVYRIDLATLESEKIVKAQEGVWSWYADDKGVVRTGVGGEGKKWWVVYRERADQAFARTKRREYDEDDVGVDKFLPLGGSDSGYAVAAGKSGRFGLYRYDFRADAIGEQIYENPEVDIDDFDLKDGKLSAVYFTNDKPQVEWFDPDLKKLQARLDRTLPGHANRVISRSADNMRLLILSASADDPGTVYFYDRQANRMSPFATLYQKLDGKRLAPMEPIRYQARDGLEIRGYLTLPPGRGDKKLPLVVMPHGGPFVRDSWGYDAWVQYLASRGYAVLQPNYRGSTGFGKAFVEKGVGQFGRGMQDDVDDGVKWLAGRGTVDAKRVCIMGASYGGYAAMLAAVRNPEIYRCAISFAGLSDVSAQLRYDRKSFAAARYFRNWRDKVRGDKDFELDTISPLKMAERMTVPILIAHGTKDRTVPVSQSQKLHDALLKLNRPHDFILYKDEGHGLADPAHATDFLNRVGAFLDKNNPAGP